MSTPPAVLVDEGDALPTVAAIRRAENASLFLWTIQVAEGSHVHAIRVGGVYHHTPDAAGRLKSLVLPAIAAIRRSVHAVAD
jgi:hypothetical protein